MNNIDDVLKRYADKDEKIQLKNWLKDYIVPLDKDEITWLQLDHVGMQKFLEENYVDEKGNRIGWYNSMLYNVLGMKYLAFCNIALNFNYLIGVIPNNIGKLTIYGKKVFVHLIKFIWLKKRKSVCYFVFFVFCFRY